MKNYFLINAFQFENSYYFISGYMLRLVRSTGNLSSAYNVDAIIIFLVLVQVGLYNYVEPMLEIN